MSFFSKFLGRKNNEHPDGEPESQPLVSSEQPQMDFQRDESQGHGDWIGGRFEILETHSGGMGIVHFCLDHHREIPVALKTFKPEYLPDRTIRDRFLREGTVWVELGRHPHIVHCFEALAPGIGPEVYLVLELIAPAPGKTDASLRAWVRRNQPLSTQQAMLFALHIVRGMQYATDRMPGLVHRDLKPENVLIGPDGRARITDFGLASVLSQLDGQALGGVGDSVSMNRTHLTQGIVGTPVYMAPEQWQAGETIDARADIYAVGCILYEMLTARIAVTGRDLYELQQAHRTGRVEPIPPRVPAELANLVRRCMTPNREKRYSSWEDLESALTKVYRSVFGDTIPAVPHAEAEIREERVAVAWSCQVIGASYMDLGKYEVAKRYFERGVQTGKEEGHLLLEGAGLYNLGILELRVGRAQHAIGLLDSALSIARDTGWLEEGAILAKLGNAYRDLGQVERALQYYGRALAHVQAVNDLPEVGAILNSIGNLHRRSGRLEQAMGLYDQALSVMKEIEDRAGEAMVLVHLGICHRRLGQTPRAIALFEQALDVSRKIGDREGEGRALANLANAYSDIDDRQRSIEYSQQGLAIAQEVGNKRTEGIALGNLGRDYLDLGDLERAIQYCEQALLIAGEIEDVQGLAQTSCTLALALGQSDKASEALRHAEVALQAYKQIGNEELAQTVRTLIVELQNQSATSEHWDRGIAYAKQERWKEAMQEYQEALRLNSNNAGLHFNLGVAYWKDGRPQEAIPELETAIRLAPNFAEARRGLSEIHYDLADQYSQQGRQQDAVQEYRIAIDIDPDNVKAHGDLGTTLAQLGHLEEAIGEYQTALRLAPQEAKLYDGLGATYACLGNLDRARSEFESAIQIDPNYLGARYNLAGIHMQQGRLTEAIQEYKTVLRLNPQDAAAHHLLGAVYAQQGRWDEAIRMFRAALQIDPSLAEAHYSLGVAHRTQGRLNDAIAEFKAALRINPDYADARVNLAGHHMQQGRLDDAIQEYRHVLKSNPNYVEVRYNLGLAYYNKSRVQDAIHELRIAAKSGFEPAARALAQLGVR